MTVSANGNMLACGFSDSLIKVWSLTDKGLAVLRTDITKNTTGTSSTVGECCCLHCSISRGFTLILSPLPCVLLPPMCASVGARREDLYDESTRGPWKELVGHSSAVYALSFSPDSLYLISASADCSGPESYF